MQDEPKLIDFNKEKKIREKTGRKKKAPGKRVLTPGIRCKTVEKKKKTGSAEVVPFVSAEKKKEDDARAVRASLRRSMADEMRKNLKMPQTATAPVAVEAVPMQETKQSTQAHNDNEPFIDGSMSLSDADVALSKIEVVLEELGMLPSTKLRLMINDENAAEATFDFIADFQEAIENDEFVASSKAGLVALQAPLAHAIKRCEEEMGIEMERLQKKAPKWSFAAIANRLQGKKPDVTELSPYAEMCRDVLNGLLKIQATMEHKLREPGVALY